MSDLALMTDVYGRNIAFLDSVFRLREMSKGFAKQFDCQPAELIGADFTHLFGPSHEIELLGQCFAVQGKGKGMFCELVVVRRQRLRQVLRVVVRAARGGLVASVHPSAQPHAGFMLTAPKARLLEQVAEGRSVDQIAAEFDVGPRSVENRIAAMLEQFGVTNPVSAVSKAYSWGLLDPSLWPPRVVAGQGGHSLLLSA
jgi:DNA-binding CsgD family transcriptional regulator